MTKKLMILAAGALMALALAVIPTGASAAEMVAHCSAAPCEGVVESTFGTVISEDSGRALECKRITGVVTQTTTTSTTVSVSLTFDECKSLSFGSECQNEGARTKNIVPNTLTGHLITVAADNPAEAGILLTGFNYSYDCFWLGFKIHTEVTGNLIGTFENTAAMCGKAVTNHTVSFTQEGGAGQQQDKTYTGKTFDLLFSATTGSVAWTTHLNYAGGKTVTITC